MIRFRNPGTQYTMILSSIKSMRGVLPNAGLTQKIIQNIFCESCWMVEK